MAPPSESTARKVASSRTAAPDSGRGVSRRTPLRVVPARRAGARGNRVLNVVAASMVVISLLVVVVGQAMLANGQVRMTAVEQQLSTEQGTHRIFELEDAALETPGRIVKLAVQSGLVSVPLTQLPYVSLTTPIPAPTLTPAPAPTTQPATGQ